jgi:hypothetical protein
MREKAALWDARDRGDTGGRRSDPRTPTLPPLPD